MKRFVVIAFLILLTGTGCIHQVHFDLLGRSELKEVVLKKSRVKDKILLLDVEGIISAAVNTGIFEREKNLITRIHSRLEKASEDKDIKAVILRLETPGGEVTASDIIYNEILKFKEKTGIPVLALMMGVAASGGYYIASASDYIMAHPSTLTGSIGVISVFPNLEELFKKIGVKVNVVKSGGMKDSGSYLKDMTEEEKKLFQDIIDEYYQKFLERVYANRKEYLSMDGLREIADGRIFTASQALEQRLIDEIGYFDSALEKTLSIVSLREAKVIAYTYHPGRKTNIYASSSKTDFFPILKTTSLENLFPFLKSGFYYLWLPEF